MEKLAVGPNVDPRRISLKYSVAHNLEAIANCLGKPVRCAAVLGGAAADSTAYPVPHVAFRTCQQSRKS